MPMVQVDEAELEMLRTLKALVDQAPLLMTKRMHGHGSIIGDRVVFVELGKDHEYALQGVVVLLGRDAGRRFAFETDH